MTAPIRSVGTCVLPRMFTAVTIGVGAAGDACGSSATMIAAAANTAAAQRTTRDSSWGLLITTGSPRTPFPGQTTERTAARLLPPPAKAYGPRWRRLFDA